MEGIGLEEPICKSDHAVIRVRLSLVALAKMAGSSEEWIRVDP